MMGAHRTASLLLLLAALGCGDDPPAAGSRYLPVAVGNRWVYDEVAVAGSLLLGTVTKEVTGSEELDGQRTFVRITTQTNSPVTKRSNWLVEGTQITRRRQDRLDEQGNLLTSRTYDPGFLRFDGSLDAVGASLNELHLRSEFNPAGTMVDQRQKSYTWTVEAVAESVTVPAGTFSCLKVRRVDSDVGDERYWYAPGVGVVKEDDGVEQELLREYSVAD